MSDNFGIDNVDELYDNIMGTGSADGPTGNTNTVEESTAPETKAAPVTVDEFEFVHNGKPIKANRDNVLKWAQQGYDYSQKMADFNRRLHETNSKYEQAESIYKTYGPIDEWVKANPDKWEALQRAIEGVEASGENPKLLQKLQTLESKILEADKFIQSVQQREQQQKVAEEDQALDAEIKSIREKYADLDWNAANENGHSLLEVRVLEHATKNGINSFRAAFHDLMHEDLMKASEARGRESLTKERKAKEAQGLLGTSQAPTKGLSKPNNLKSKTYDDLMREGLEELGISL